MVITRTCVSFTIAMVLEFDVSSEHVAHAERKIGLFGEKKFDLCMLSN